MALLSLLMCLSGCSPVGIEELHWKEGDGAEVSDSLKEGAGEAADKAREGAEWASQKASDGAQALRETGENALNAAESALARGWLKACLILRGWAAFAIIGSMLVGLALVEIFPKNAEIRKFGIVTMCARIPILTILLTYLTAFAYGLVAGRRTARTEARALPGKICVAWFEAADKVKIPALIFCILLVGIGIFCMEKYRENPDIVKTSKKYLCFMIPLAVFLALVAYPVMYGLFA